jgi:hypothetical protein
MKLGTVASDALESKVTRDDCEENEMCADNVAYSLKAKPENL